MKGGQISSTPSKELTRETELTEEENEHTANKSKEQDYLVDKIARKNTTISFSAQMLLWVQSLWRNI